MCFCFFLSLLFYYYYNDIVGFVGLLVQIAAALREIERENEAKSQGPKSFMLPHAVSNILGFSDLANSFKCAIVAKV